MNLSYFSSSNFSVSPSNKKLTTITQLPEYSAAIKSSQNKQLQQMDLDCTVKKSLDKIISDLERVFNYDDYNQKKSIYTKLWDKINKNEDYRNYVLWEAQADKGKRSDALCCFLVEQSRLIVEGNILYKPETEKVENSRRTELCEEVLRKFVVRGVQAEIDSIATMKVNSQNWNGNDELKKQESTLSRVSYILGLTTNKKDGAKDRLGIGPVASVIGDMVNNARRFLQLRTGSEQPNIDVLHRITDVYYRCHSVNEKLPNQQIIDDVIQEVRASVRDSNLASAKGLPYSIDPESSAYRLISKTILDPTISAIYHQQMTSKILANTYRKNNVEKNKPTIEIQKEYLVVDETLDLKSSQLYKDVEKCLLDINENLTENDISLCAEDYYEFFRERLDLNVPSLALLKFLQSQRGIQNKSGIQNKRDGIVLTNN
ncbi:TPA: hypothetical protein ACQ31I_000701 [Yersinia enterocolitica]